MHANPTYMQMSSNVGIVIKTVRASAYMCVYACVQICACVLLISASIFLFSLHARTDQHAHYTHARPHTLADTYLRETARDYIEQPHHESLTTGFLHCPAPTIPHACLFMLVVYYGVRMLWCQNVSPRVRTSPKKKVSTNLEIMLLWGGYD